jgi:hypothetical protein
MTLVTPQLGGYGFVIARSEIPRYAGKQSPKRDCFAPLAMTPLTPQVRRLWICHCEAVRPWQSLRSVGRLLRSTGMMLLPVRLLRFARNDIVFPPVIEEIARRARQPVPGLFFGPETIPEVSSWFQAPPHMH